MLAVSLVLLSAGLHVTWNLLLKSSGDKFTTMYLMRLVMTAVMLPVVVLFPPPAQVVPHLIATAVLHTVYTLTLTHAYEIGEYSLVYPLARGMSPVLASIVALVLLGEVLPIGGWALLLTSVTGLLIMGLTSAGDTGSGKGAVLWSLVTGSVIAMYTVVDAAGVRITGNAIVYVSAAFLSDLIVLTPIFLSWRRRGRISSRVPAADLRRAVLGGPLQLAAYGLVLSALRIAPVGYISSVRETGVIMSAIAGWLLLGESFGALRVVATILVAGGIAGLTVLLGV